MGNLHSELGQLGLRVLELFAMYATDGQIKATLIARLPTVGSIIIRTIGPESTIYKYHLNYFNRDLSSAVVN